MLPRMKLLVFNKSGIYQIVAPKKAFLIVECLECIQKRKKRNKKIPEIKKSFILGYARTDRAEFIGFVDENLLNNSLNTLILKKFLAYKSS